MRIGASLAAVLAAATLAGCSINTLVANALTGDGASVVFTGDSDPELVAGALPFAIKMYEALLYTTPNHQGLMLTTGSLFVMYANAFVHGPADMLPFNEWEARAEALDRAERLYMRGHRIFIDALEQRHRGFSAAVGNEDAVRRYLQKFRRRDVPLLYWTVVSGLAAYSINVQNLELNAYIPSWHLMIERAIELDPDFGGETLDEFLVLYFASLPDTLGGSMERAHYHFDRAMEKTGGNSTSALLAYARTVSVREQDFDTFQEYLGRILALDPDDNPATRLMVILDQRKAQWLLDNAEDFF